jgi:hypothetical protein
MWINIAGTICLQDEARMALFDEFCIDMKAGGAGNIV